MHLRTKTPMNATDEPTLHANGAHWLPNQRHRPRLILGSRMNRQEVLQCIAKLAHQYANKPWPKVTDGRFRFKREIELLKLAQMEFYAEMSYFESLLVEETPVLSLQASTTTVVDMYQPAQPRRRGRPSTGGRKPKPTTRKGRRNEEESE